MTGEGSNAAVVKVDTLAIEGDPLTAVICTLRNKGTEQTNLNLVFGYDVTTKFSVVGDAKYSVFLSGYYQPAPEDFSDEEGDFDGEEGDEENSEDEESSEEDAPALKALPAAKAAPAKAAAPAAKAQAAPAAKPVAKADKIVVKDVSDEEDDSEDDDDDEDIDSVDEKFIQVSYCLKMDLSLPNCHI